MPLNLLLQFFVLNPVMLDLFVLLLSDFHGLGHELGNECEKA